MRTRSSAYNTNAGSRADHRRHDDGADTYSHDDVRAADRTPERRSCPDRHRQSEGHRLGDLSHADRWVATRGTTCGFCARGA